MSFSFQAEDRQFVTSTGANLTPDAPSTRFDGPPEASTGLVITPKGWDDDPRLFELGDTYDLVWEGNSIMDATVVRSDAVGQGGVVGFSGTDASGNPAMLLWTPDFDLQAWYESVGGRASFYTSDRQAGYTHEFVCFAAGALIDAPGGAVPVERLTPGDRVLTLDAGPQVVRWVGRKTVCGKGAGAPVRFGADGLRLSQQHRVMLAAPLAEILFGTSEVLMPARALLCPSQVWLEPCPWITYVHVLLDQHHILKAEGMACESLFVGPLALPHVDLIGVPADLGRRIRHGRTARPVLSYREARLLLGLLADDRHVTA